jgi:trk system potassium uptake protein TrkA
MVVEEGPLVGQPLKRFREITQDNGIMVGAIAHGQRVLVPSGDDVISKNDMVYFVYLSASQKNLLAALNRSRHVLSSVCIVGGGSIGLKLAKRLEGKNIRVKLFERDEQRCEELAEELGSTLVLRGDGTDKNMLKEESVDTMDVLAALTSDDETNILACLLAKSMGTRETVVRVSKSAYLPLFQNLGIDHSVSPRMAVVNCILQYIRQGGILSSISVGGEAAEMIEVKVGSNSALANRLVREMGLPKGALLLGLVRGADASIPTGNTEVMPGDHLIILVERGVMAKMENILSEK